MKTTSLLFVMCIMLFVFFSCSNEENDFVIGKESLTVEEISKVKLIDSKGKQVSTDDLKLLWENQMKEEGFFVKLNTFEIIETYDSQNNKVFFLKSVSKDGTIETGAFLLKQTEAGGNVYVLGGKECSCKGCPNGCNLVVTGSKCSCTGCPTDTSKKCEKTERVIIGYE